MFPRCRRNFALTLSTYEAGLKAKKVWLQTEQSDMNGNGQVKPVISSTRLFHTKNSVCLTWSINIEKNELKVKEAEFF